VARSHLSLRLDGSAGQVEQTAYAVIVALLAATNAVRMTIVAVQVVAPTDSSR
jgi:hypothetical protein